MIGDIEFAAGRVVSRETLQSLHQYANLVRQESAQQNLIAASTLDALWDRHIIDSAQLCRFARPGGSWLDIGSGAGLPGLVVAVLTKDPVTLVEPRKLRADFLRRAAEQLALANVTVVASKIERVEGQFDIITARAVASLDQIFYLAHRLAGTTTRWILPKGRSGALELAEAKRSWQGHFRIEPSITDGDAGIVIAEQVKPRERGGG